MNLAITNVLRAPNESKGSHPLGEKLKRFAI